MYVIIIWSSRVRWCWFLNRYVAKTSSILIIFVLNRSQLHTISPLLNWLHSFWGRISLIPQHKLLSLITKITTYPPGLTVVSAYLWRGQPAPWASHRASGSICCHEDRHLTWATFTRGTNTNNIKVTTYYKMSKTFHIFNGLFDNLIPLTTFQLGA